MNIFGWFGCGRRHRDGFFDGRRHHHDHGRRRHGGFSGGFGGFGGY